MRSIWANRPTNHPSGTGRTAPCCRDPNLQSSRAQAVDRYGLTNIIGVPGRSGPDPEHHPQTIPTEPPRTSHSSDVMRADDWEATLVRGYELPNRSTREWVHTTIVVVTIIVVLGACITGLRWLRSQLSGDPGGRVMAQLTPAVTSLPGYGTIALPWVSEQPPSLGAPYIIRMEPYPDSCDGGAGTQGWTPVVVQAGFRWVGDISSLTAYMEPRLAKLGWTLQSEPQGPSPSGRGWTKTLRNGTPATLDVSQEGSNNWELVAEGEPVGGAASGC